MLSLRLTSNYSCGSQGIKSSCASTSMFSSIVSNSLQPNRQSFALDGIEALRPYVDLWLLGYLVNSVFANRDFSEMHDGEVRLTHPLNAHLAHTAALWRQVSEPVADWLKGSFIRAAETSLAHTRRSLTPTPKSRQAVLDGMADSWKEFAEFKATQVDTGKRPASEGFGTREFMKNDYMARMSAAALGIYGNSKEEALYPAYFVDAHGEKLNGSHRYILSFTPDQLPPVNSVLVTHRL
jgi:Protein of unknown function (DUF1214)